jgi:ribonuclease HII
MANNDSHDLTELEREQLIKLICLQEQQHNSHNSDVITKQNVPKLNM